MVDACASNILSIVLSHKITIHRGATVMSPTQKGAQQSMWEIHLFYSEETLELVILLKNYFDLH